MKNEPAFPRLGLNIQDQSTGEFVPHDPGMTLRDYFAAKAMQGFCANPNLRGSDWMPADAYKIADAMLKQRSV